MSYFEIKVWFWTFDLWLQGGEEEDDHPGGAHHRRTASAGYPADTVWLPVSQAGQVQGEDSRADCQNDWLWWDWGMSENI